MTIEEILKLRQEAGGLNKLMHMHVVTLDKDGGATVELDLTPELLNPLGMAHGGTIFTLCDIAAGSAAASQGTVAFRGSGRPSRSTAPSTTTVRAAAAKS